MRLESFCTKFLRFGVYVSLIAPFIVFPWSIYPYLYGKALYLNIVVALMLPAYVILLTLKPEMKPPKNALTVLVSGFFGVLLLSTIFSDDPGRSFWGTQERSAGLFFLLHYFILFLITSSIFRDLASWRRLFKFSIFVSLLVVGSVWWDIAMDKIWNPSAGTRTGGTLSNPIFYAAYLLFHIPLAYWFFLDSWQKKWKIFWAFVFFIFSVSLLFTLTRGAMLALFGTFVLALFIMILVVRKYRKLGIAALCATVAVTILLFSFKGVTANWPIVGRFVSISPREITAQTRFEAWHIAWRGFLERPILGWGPENYYLIFNKLYNPKLLRFSYYETWSDKPHNIIFETLSTSGILGIIFYLGIYFVIFWKTLKKILAESLEARIGVPLAAVFMGYLIQNLFGIDSVSTYLMFYILLAFAGFVLYPASASYAKAAGLTNLAKNVKRPVALAGILTSIVSIVSIWQWSIEPAYAGYLTAKATAVTTFGEATDLWRKALTIRTPWSYDAAVEYLKGLTRLLQKTKSDGYGELQNLLSAGEIAAETLTDKHPKNAYFNYLVGRFYSERGRFEFKYFDPAEKYLLASIKLSPERQQLFYGLGKLYLTSGRTSEALEVFKKLVELDSQVDESHMFYGLALREVGRSAEAYTEVREAIKLGYRAVDPGEILVLAEVATKENDLEALREIYGTAIVIDPKNGDWYARLAALELELGNKERARELVIHAVELDSSLKEEATKFLKLLQ